MVISVIVPVLNEEAASVVLAGRMRALERQGLEVIVVDGGSQDRTVEILLESELCVLSSPPGRALQMNLGASSAVGEVLLFLHADTELPERAQAYIKLALQRGWCDWGRFNVRITGRSRWLPVVAFLMNWRSALTGIATGDQAIFVRAKAFAEVGGFPEQPLMEDVELCCQLLREVGRPACLREKVSTSGRRWDSRGAWPTILLMWRLRWAYWRGVPAESLAELYQ